MRIYALQSLSSKNLSKNRKIKEFLRLVGEFGADSTEVTNYVAWQSLVESCAPHPAPARVLTSVEHIHKMLDDMSRMLFFPPQEETEEWAGLASITKETK